MNGNLKKGQYVIIEDGVTIGDNVTLGHRVTLKSGTYVGNDVIIADHCITTGACVIGNNVNIRTGAIISKETMIMDDCFIGPGVTTNHTRRIGEPPLKTLIGKGCVVGSQASILAGVEIASGTIIGAGAVVTRTIYKAGTYVGNPARRIK